ncbi:hypothetical protein DSOUD_0441 [Desulfuromonas soudanensis]|uniref:Uncharacterized protein n=1 Tax=Desulfuromonas soudanensis TaxID=1603606 RepID=A0A0M4D404_9BACT|nr:hypothetical protein [Desulfuromonas soudanensis]ALC15235.1 hypothetical protein DSOUD_0441 [Desulfuromonas soudanensis]
MEIRYFVFSDQNRPEPLPTELFWKIYDRRVPLPGEARRRVRFASVEVRRDEEVVGGAPLTAVRFRFDRRGFIRSGETKKYTLCSALTTALTDLARVTSDQDLLDTHRLFRKKTRNPFEWAPTPEEIAAMNLLVAAGER